MAKKAAAKAPAKAATSANKGGKTAPGGKSSSSAKRMTKSAIYAELAEKTDLPRKKVTEVFDALQELIRREVGPGGPGEIVLPPGGLKVKRVHRKERPAGQSRNPRTGEMVNRPARPAHSVVKAQPMKTLRDLYPKPR